MTPKTKLALTCAVAALLTLAAGCSGDGSGTEDRGLARPLVTQYVGIFNDGKQDNFGPCLDLNPPYALWSITFIAFVHTFERNGLYVADYENARGLDARGEQIPPSPGDTDRDRIRRLVEAARAVNPSMRFVISLGWGRGDFPNGARNPVEFAASVGRIVEENGLDGFDVDFEFDSIDEESFREVSRALRAELDARSAAMAKPLLLTITPAEIEGIDFAAVDAFYDLVQMQSYDAAGDGSFAPTNVVGQGVASEKILFGRDIEGGDTLAATRYEIADVVSYVRDNGLGGLMGWRVNSASQMSGPDRFGGVELLGHAFDATAAMP